MSARFDLDSLGICACRLDDDGCVTCADSGIPLRVIALAGDDALCEDSAGTQTMVAIDLVAPVVAGDTILMHGGVAIRKGVIIATPIVEGERT